MGENDNRRPGSLTLMAHSRPLRLPRRSSNLSMRAKAGSSLRIVFAIAVGCVAAWAPLPTLHAQSRDVRLLEAVKRRDQKAFTALLKARADVNGALPDGSTALAWAVHLGQRPMAE